MDKYEGYKIILKEVLSEKRYAHSLSVADTAAKLAIINDADAEKAYLAGLMHDYAKDIPEDKLLAIAQEQGIIKDEAEILAPYILHGPVGAYLLRERKIITDEEILQAIALHTTGAAEMTLLDNIIYMADYIEPGRKHGNVDNIRTITYKYSTGDALPSIEKTASVKDAKVGDEITYTIKLSNDKKASSAWKSVVLTDKIPSGMTFIEGSVYVNNVAATHTVKNGTLTVNLGDIAAGKTVTVTFKAKINGDMYNQTIYNTAVAKGTNGYVTATDGKKTNSYEDKDDGVYVKKGDTAPYVTKTADKETANVGDKLTYTVKVGNGDGAVYEIENAKMVDTISTEFDFVDGSVQVDGKSYPYSYDNASRKLSVQIGNLKPNTARTVTFAVTVGKSAYGKTVHNTAVLSGDNIKDTEGKDNGVTVGDGKAKPQIDKAANKSSARVGDKIAYTLTVKNDDTATVPVENGVITDVLPAGLTFEYGSVTLNGKNTNDYTYDENTRLLTVNVGTIEPDAKQIIGFTATVNESAYNTIIQNLATLTSDNADPVQDKDDGVAIADGDALLTVSKSADKTIAKVGDTITYTVNAANATGADVNIRDAVMTDTIPNVLTFCGNVTVDGYSAEYQYDNTGKTLTVSLGEIAPNQTKAIRFDVTVNSDAYGMHIENTALVSGSNTPDKSGTDNGVDIEDGTADGHAGNKTETRPSQQLAIRLPILSAWKTAQQLPLIGRT